MKYKSIILGLLALATLGLTSCEDEFLDMKPLDKKTDANFWTRAQDFQEYANNVYNMLPGWVSGYGNAYNFMDQSTDLSAYFSADTDLAHGVLTTPSTDNQWDKSYSNIRYCNTLLVKAEGYANPSEIKQPVGECYFVRAFSYWWLLKRFGGVPIVQKVLDIDSEELFAPRNSRYEVVAQILSDLDNAIANLSLPSQLDAANCNRITKYAAEAMKMRVLLYEATWRKYNGTSTDFKGSAGPSSDQVEEFLTEAVRLAKDIIDNGGYRIWNYNSRADVKNLSSFYLFCLEKKTTNDKGEQKLPEGLTKDTNKEFILYQLYDEDNKKSRLNINQSIAYQCGSRKLMDMFLCTDGLTVMESPLFQGYAQPADEFKNRDYRMAAYFETPPYEKASTMNLTDGRSGYPVKKWTNPLHITSTEESANYPIIRYAEVLLDYAEALYELKGQVSDDDLNYSINHIRARAGLPKLTNAFISEHNMNMLNEIRRERAIELFGEGFRFDDLKRWGIAEESLNADRAGRIVGGVNYPTRYRDANGNATEYYTTGAYVNGEVGVETRYGTLNAVLIDGKSSFRFSKTNYLYPIPSKQIGLNNKLVQNPGY